MVHPTVTVTADGLRAASVAAGRLADLHARVAARLLSNPDPNLDDAARGHALEARAAMSEERALYYEGQAVR